MSILEKLKNTQIAENSLYLLGKIIRKEFDAEKNHNKAFALLQLAYKYQTPQFEEMIEDFEITDFLYF